MARTYATYEEAKEIALGIMGEDYEDEISDTGVYIDGEWFSRKTMYYTIIAALTGDPWHATGN